MEGVDGTVVARTPRPLRCAALAAALACSPQPSGPPDLLLITVDTLRADHLSSYGHHNQTTPTLDALAARGVRFEDAMVQAPKTWPSVASLLTGTYPATTGVRIHFHKHWLADRNLTLAEILQAAGWQTGAVVANVNLGAQFGFSQGFAHYVESWVDGVHRRHGDERTVLERPGEEKLYARADLVNEQALRWLGAIARDRPFFLWLHYMDPHGPYDPPPSHAGRFAGTYPREPVDWKQLPSYQRRFDARTGLPLDDLGAYKARYDAEISFFDDALKRLLDGLVPLGRARPLLLAVTADHGESLGEHAYYLLHGRLPYQPTARVPLVLVQEGRLPPGLVVREPVALLDVVPTLLALLGVPAPPTLQGESLVPHIRSGGAAQARDVFMESGPEPPYTLSVRRGPWKLVHHRSEAARPEGAAEWQLYDLERDPGETDCVLDEHPELVASLREALDRWERSVPVATESGPAPEVDAASRRMLQALGYATP
jgi:arylsulfatase